MKHGSKWVLYRYILKIKCAAHIRGKKRIHISKASKYKKHRFRKIIKWQFQKKRLRYLDVFTSRHSQKIKRGHVQAFGAIYGDIFTYFSVKQKSKNNNLQTEPRYKIKFLVKTTTAGVRIQNSANLVSNSDTDLFWHIWLTLTKTLYYNNSLSQIYLMNKYELWKLKQLPWSRPKGQASENFWLKMKYFCFSPILKFWVISETADQVYNNLLLHNRLTTTAI